MFGRDLARKKKKLRRLGRPRKRRHRSISGRLLRSALSLAMVASLTVLGFTAYRYFHHSSRLNIGEIKFMGCTNALESELLDLAGVDFKMNLTHLDLRAVSNRVARHPWVEKAQVKRDWSRKALVIEIQERAPQALILLDDLYLVDRQGKVFKKAEARDRLDYPVLTGLSRKEVLAGTDRARDSIRQGLELLALLRERRGLPLQEVSEIHLSPRDGLILFTVKEGVPIRLGTGDLADKLDRLERVLPDLKRRAAEVERVDLNYAKKVVVKLKGTESGKSRRS